jgi:hypothetical protein
MTAQQWSAPKLTYRHSCDRFVTARFDRTSGNIPRDPANSASGIQGQPIAGDGHNRIQWFVAAETLCATLAGVSAMAGRTSRGVRPIIRSLWGHTFFARIITAPAKCDAKDDRDQQQRQHADAGRRFLGDDLGLAFFNDNGATSMGGRHSNHRDQSDGRYKQTFHIGLRFVDLGR